MGRRTLILRSNAISVMLPLALLLSGCMSSSDTTFDPNRSVDSIGEQSNLRLSKTVKLRSNQLFVRMGALDFPPDIEGSLRFSSRLSLKYLNPNSQLCNTGILVYAAGDDNTLSQNDMHRSKSLSKRWSTLVAEMNPTPNLGEMYPNAIVWGVSLHRTRAAGCTPTKLRVTVINTSSPAS